MKWGAGLLVCFLLVGCVQSGYQKVAREDVMRHIGEQRNLYSMPKDTKETRDIVVYSSELYVPPLLIQENQPSWVGFTIELHFEDYPLSRAILDVLGPLGVSVRWFDQIDQHQLVSFSHRGSVGEFLRKLSDHTGLFYQLGKNYVAWQKYETAEFDIAFLAGATSYFLGGDSRANSSSNSSGSFLAAAQPSFQSSQYLNFSSTDLSVWQDVQNALIMLLSDEGTWSLNQSSTSVLVRDVPFHVELVRNYLQQLNSRLTRQVAIEVQVVDVVLTDSHQAGIDWDLVYQLTSGNGVINFTNQASSAGTQVGGALSHRRLTGPMAGSELLLSAISQQGTVSVTKHPRLVTLNNQIAQIQLEENVTYLASAGSTSTANVGTTDVLIPSMVSTGFELFVLPNIIESDVLLQLSTTLSDLNGIEQIKSGDSLIQTPQTSQKKFFMKAMVGDQETLLISGLQNSKSDINDRRGPLHRVLGGRQERQRQQTETLILLTPVILN